MKKKTHTYIKCPNYVDMARGLIITTDMLMGSIQMEIFWQSESCNLVAEFTHCQILYKNIETLSICLCKVLANWTGSEL